MGYLLKIENDKQRAIKPKPFDNEEALQEIVKKFPEIIPLEEIDENFDSLLIIGREFSLEGAGSIDLLAIDVSGLITVIEFKLEKNTDIRKVVAQVIEYAANLWELSYDILDKKVQDYFKSNRCEIKELKNKTLVQAVKWRFNKVRKEDEDTEFSTEDFIKNVSSNLQEGEFRLLIFCDNVDERTKRAVEYLNNLSGFDIYCASTDAFEVDGQKFFKSSLITIDRKKTSSSKKRAGKITFEDFLNSIPKEYREYKETYEYFDDKFKDLDGFYSMGTKGFSAYLIVRENKLQILQAYPDYIILDSKYYFNKTINLHKDMITEEEIIDFENRISNIRPFKNSFGLVKKNPHFKFNKFKPNDLKEYIDTVFDWYKKWYMDK